jgi:hypothetical protein
MLMNSKKLALVLEELAPALMAKGPYDQSNCFVFTGGRVWTFNDSLALSVASPFGEELEGAVDGADLLQVRTLPGAELNIRLVDGRLQMYGKACRFSLPWQEKVRLPVAAIPVPETWETLDKGFDQMRLKIVSDSLGGDIYPVLSCLHLTKGFVEASNNLEITRAKWDSPVEDGVVKGVSLLSVKGMKQVAVSPGWLHMTDGKLQAHLRLLKVDYPSWDDYLGAEEESFPVQFPEEVLQAVRRMRGMCSGAARTKLSISKTKVVLYSKTEKGTSYREEVACRSEGEDSVLVRLDTFESLLVLSPLVEVGKKRLRANKKEAKIVRVICRLAPEGQESQTKEGAERDTA